MKNFDLSENEEKTLVGILYNHISFSTTMEVFGEITEDGVKRLGLLRGILAKLLKKYSLADKLTEDTYLLLGMTEFVAKESLKKLSENEDNKHLQIRAHYFLKK